MGKEATKLRNKRILCSNWTIIVEGSEKKLDFFIFCLSKYLKLMWNLYCRFSRGIFFEKNFSSPSSLLKYFFLSSYLYKKNFGFHSLINVFLGKNIKRKRFFFILFPSNHQKWFWKIFIPGIYFLCCQTRFTAVGKFKVFKKFFTLLSSNPSW